VRFDVLGEILRRDSGELGHVPAVPLLALAETGELREILKDHLAAVAQPLPAVVRLRRNPRLEPPRELAVGKGPARVHELCFLVVERGGEGAHVGVEESAVEEEELAERGEAELPCLVDQETDAVVARVAAVPAIPHVALALGDAAEEQVLRLPRFEEVQTAIAAGDVEVGVASRPVEEGRFAHRALVGDEGAEFRREQRTNPAFGVARIGAAFEIVDEVADAGDVDLA
jgi:hypothetical protein